MDLGRPEHEGEIAMMPSERDIFLQALEISDLGERRRFLENACKDDQQLRERVDWLLRAHFSDAPDLLSSLDREDQSGSSSRPLPHGGVIDRYRLIEQIGEGGCGVVYRAEQTEPVQRAVALKVIKPGMDSQQVIARFEAERQALARLDHPNIANILDAGETPRQLPYFVMDLVDGLPITTFCDHHQLTIEQRLDILIQVCSAIQHAHQKGIIHRDIKPSNILVTKENGEAKPVVIDFGVAKAIDTRLTEYTIATKTNQVIGTPQYMSPEQTDRSEVDTRTDVYSLGILLYELLAGSPPLDSDRMRQMAYDEVCRAIREEEVPAPSARLSSLGEGSNRVSDLRNTNSIRLSRLVSGDLDWITIKAIEKDQPRRYESVDALASDLRRFLNHEPVVAGPPGFSYRLRKLVRRHRAVSLAVLAVLLVATVGAVVSTISFHHADYYARVVEQERDKLDRQTFDQLLLSAMNNAGSLRQGQQRDGLKSVRQAMAISNRLGFTDDRMFELRSAVAACISYPDLAIDRQWRVPTTPSAHGFDREMQLCCFVDSGNSSVLNLLEVESGNIRRHGLDHSIVEATPSPDGNYVYIRSTTTSCLMSTAADFEKLLKFPNGSGRSSADFSRDGRFFAFSLGTSAGTLVRVCELPTARIIFDKLVGPVTEIALSPNGSKLMIVAWKQRGRRDDDRGLFIYGVGDGEMIYESVFPNQGAFNTPIRAKWHPNDEATIILAFGKKLFIKRIDKTEQEQRIDTGVISDFLLSDNGRFLFTIDGDATRVWDAVSGRTLLEFNRRILQVGSKSELVGFSGRTIAGRCQFFPNSAFKSTPIAGSNQDTRFFCVHPRGRLGVAGGMGKSLELQAAPSP